MDVARTIENVVSGRTCERSGGEGYAEGCSVAIVRGLL